MGTIKTWQERGNWDENFVPQYDGMPAWEAIKAENAELRAALAKQADAAPVDAVREALQMLYDDRYVIEVITAKHAAQVAAALAQRVVSETVPVTTIPAKAIAANLVNMLDEWMAGGGNWREGLPDLIEHRLTRFIAPPAAPVALSDDEQVQAWIAVTEALDKCMPDWLSGPLSGLDSAVKAIDELSAQRNSITDLAIVKAANEHLTSKEYIYTADIEQICAFVRTILAAATQPTNKEQK